jgi:hypothetical protein
MSRLSVPLINVEAFSGRQSSALRVGVPLPREWASEENQLSAHSTGAEDGSTVPVPMQGRVLARWPDRSIKWLLVDLDVAHLSGQSAARIELRRASGEIFSSMHVDPLDDGCKVDTGSAVFEFRAGSSHLISSISIPRLTPILSDGLKLVLFDAQRRDMQPRVSSVTVEESGKVRTVVLIRGVTSNNGGLEFTARCSLSRGCSTATLEVCLRNSNAARHAGGLWDLGDPQSVLINEASLVISPVQSCEGLVWRVSPMDSIQKSGKTDWQIRQESSGGENWDSPNHVEADGSLGVAFRGYAIRGAALPDGGSSGWRAQPTLGVLGEDVGIAASIQNFWQNFPKSLAWTGRELRIGLFPDARRCPIELQGGEQKRHRVSISIGAGAGGAPLVQDAESAIDPPHVWVDPAWVQSTGAVRGFVTDLSSSAVWNDYVRTIVDGSNSFNQRREVIDEYGWRNFGDLWADHEAVNHDASIEPFVSHYNNQYDFIWGAGVHALRTGDARWDRLAREAAEHTVDIDIYHTQCDRAAFNGGLFWHTDHYLAARRSTHRTYSADNASSTAYGGGPGNEHNYAAGMLLHYWRTGDPDALEAVTGLAEWVIAMDDGSRTLLGVLDSGPTGIASQTVSGAYHGPGRGAGNSIATLLDGYLATGERRFLLYAETLIQRCIHPEDDIDARQLNDIEHRWSYLVFLQSLGRYLEMKLERGETDYLFHYARESLLHYADWMLANEVPYKDVLDRVELPTETWPAQDVRKCHIMHLAARFDSRGKCEVFTERAAFFHDQCLDGLSRFDTRFLTRPLVLLAVYGHLHAYYGNLPSITDQVKQSWRHDHAFGLPQPFSSQRSRAKSSFRARLRVAREDVGRIVRDRLLSLKKARRIHRRADQSGSPRQ